MRKQAIIRAAAPEWDQLRQIVLSRYPRKEWATFLRFGWRPTPRGLVLTLAAIDSPQPGDLDDRVAHVAITEPYTLRTALAAEAHNLAVGVVHSHPESCAPIPSPIDDDMDAYYSKYFGDFAPGRPYVSVVVSIMDGDLAVSGRVYWEDHWFYVSKFAIELTLSTTWVAGLPARKGQRSRERAKRLSAAFGLDAEARLRESAVAVIGAGGTGSAAIEVLARAGVGRLIIVDPDHLSESNLERVHGSVPEHASKALPKVNVAAMHVHSIDPSCEVEAYIGALPQESILDAVIRADVVLGCTDQQHSRLALSDLAIRYLVPAIDCGVLLEGQDGQVRAQVIQLVRFLAADACALCRGMIEPNRLAQELMPEAERKQRQVAARAAEEQGQQPNAYWQDMPQLNTVGYLTTAAGAMAAGYAIGWITGRSQPPFQRLQMNLVAPYLDVTDNEQVPRPTCACRRMHGWADQGKEDALVTAPAFWPTVQSIGNGLRFVSRERLSRKKPRIAKPVNAQ